MENLGVMELKAVLKFVFSLANLAEAAAKGISFSLIGPVFSVVKAAPGAISAFKSGLIIREFKDLDDAERSELKDWSAQELDLENDSIEIVVEKCLSIAIDLSQLLKNL